MELVRSAAETLGTSAVASDYRCTVRAVAADEPAASWTGCNNAVSSMHMGSMHRVVAPSLRQQMGAALPGCTMCGELLPPRLALPCAVGSRCTGFVACPHASTFFIRSRSCY